MYYFCDNTLWFVGILIKGGVVDKSIKRGWKYYKNSFSLSRIIAYLVILFYSVYLDTKEIIGLRNLMKKVESRIGQDHTATKDLGDLLIKLRRKVRFYYL